MPSGLTEIVFPVVASLEKDWEDFKRTCGIQDETPYLDAVTMPDACLVNIQIGICTACNYNCPMCFNHFDTHYGYYSNRWLSFDEFKQFILINTPINDLTFAVSGEPFLHPDIFKMMDFATPHVKSFTFSTNGALLTDEKIERLKTYPVNKIYLSIDGSDRESYETFRKNGVFEEIKPVIAKLAEAFGDKLIAACTVFRENRESLVGMPKLLHELGVAHMVLFRLFEHPGAHDKGIHKLSAREMEAFMCDLLDACDRYGIKAGWDTRAVNKTIAGKIARHSHSRYASDSSIYNAHCSIPFHNLLVDGEGNYNFCCSLEPIPAQALTTPSRALYNSRYIKIMRVMNMLRRFPSVCKKYCGKIDDPAMEVSLENLKRLVKKETFESMTWRPVARVEKGESALVVPSGTMTRIMLENGLGTSIHVEAVIDRNAGALSLDDKTLPLLTYDSISSLHYDTVIITSGAFWREILFWFYENDPQWHERQFYRIEITQRELLHLDNTGFIV